MSLEKLQEIRERRLDKQRKEVQERKAIMDQAELKLEESRQNLTQFHQWRLNHQEDLFKGLQGQACSPQGMFEYRAKLEKLSEEEEALKSAIVQAQEELKETQQHYVQARKVANELSLKNEKTKEIIEIQEKAELAIQRAKE